MISMSENIFEVFFTTLFFIALLHSALASCTKILYRKKSWGRLTHNQLKVVQGDATFSQRIELFFHTFFTSFLTPTVYGFTLGACVLYLGYIYLL